MTLVDDNTFPKLELSETTAPSNPAAGKRRLYVDSNHVLRWLDSSGLDSPLAALNKWNGTTAPTVNEDSGDGYAIGSRWIDTTADKEYVCTDATVGAAVWKETTATGGGGAVATDAIWDTKGDLAVGTGADTAAKLAAGPNGLVLTTDSAQTTGLKYGPMGDTEYDYAENTNATITLSGASAAAATTIITGASITLDGSTRVKVEFGCYSINTSGVIELYDGSTDLGRLGFGNGGVAFYAKRFLTPSNGSHQFIIKGWRGTGSNATIDSGSGGSNAVFPAWYRVSKA